MHRILVLFLLMLSISLPAFSIKETTPAAVVAKNVPDLQSVSCKFVQERNFGTNVVKSSGDFKFIKGKGVFFMTTYPVKSTSSYTSTNNKYINDVIMAVSKKNFSKIDSEFNMYLNKPSNSQNWNILMTAKDEKIKNHIDSVKIYGDNTRITRITVNQVNPAVKTDIKFQFGG